MEATEIEKVKNYREWRDSGGGIQIQKQICGVDLREHHWVDAGKGIEETLEEFKQGFEGTITMGDAHCGVFTYHARLRVPFDATFNDGVDFSLYRELDFRGEGLTEESAFQALIWKLEGFFTEHTFNLAVHMEDKLEKEFGVELSFLHLRRKNML